jgi:hypothetical protein
MNAITCRPSNLNAAVNKAVRAVKAAENAMNAARDAVIEEFYAELPTAYVMEVGSDLLTVVVWRASTDTPIGFGYSDGQWEASHNGDVGAGPTVHAALADLSRHHAAVVSAFLADCA